jgi:Zn-dependent protease with chaperone function
MLRALISLALIAWGAIGCLPARADGVDVGKPTSVRNLDSAGALERQAVQEYEQLKRQAAGKRALASDDHPQVKRLRVIAARMIPFVDRFNPRARQWQWEVNLIGSKQINAFCMPGGKIVFYTGILDTLKLTDDEVAMVMGHEIAHALREHARERMAKNQMTQLGASLLGELVGGGRYTGAFQLGGNLLSLKFSRDDESEADIAGLDLAARAGFDPRAAVTLWQKMAAANSRAPLEFLSTHPAGENRIKEIQGHLPAVMPLYEKARKAG